MNDFIQWIVSNWFVVLGVIALIVVVVFSILGFFNLPTEKQKAKIKEWLIWACIEAEKALQSGTGKLKLREVWNQFIAIPTFSFIAKIITFDVFEQWVTEALEIVKLMLINNPSLAVYVYGDNAENEVKKIKLQIAEGVQNNG